jgi:hypothetical protein
MSLNPITPEYLYQRLVTRVTQSTQTHEKQPLDGLYLSTIEWKNINTILNHNDSTPELRNKVKNLIYNCYEKWCFSIVSIISQKYREKCEPIHLDELKLYGYIGLRKALINYDSTKYNLFTNYAVKYIYSEVLDGIYELSPMYTFCENYKNKKKQKVLNRIYKHHKHDKRNENQKQTLKYNKNTNISRKKMAITLE